MSIKVEFIPATKWYRRAKWRLLEEYVSANGLITVPVGFITDGASIPFFARAFFSPTGRYFGAAIVHDYILVTEQNWPKANHQFDLELKALGISNIRRSILVGSVRLWAAVRRVLGLGQAPRPYK